MNKREIQQLLKQKNLHPIKKWGQNFLTHQPTIQKITARVQKLPPPFVEIGPGLGALTRHFPKKADITLIERDKKLAGYWKEQGYAVLAADALKLNWPAVLPEKLTLFGNLPYEIASRLVIKASLCQPQITNMVFMMQKEAAQRALAKPRSENYGFLSVVSQTFWNMSLVAQAPRSHFYPAPKVDGAVLEFQAKKKIPGGDSALFVKFVKHCFSLKRKMLFKKMEGCSAQKAKNIFKDLGLSAVCRAEELSPQQFIQLYPQIHPL